MRSKSENDIIQLEWMLVMPTEKTYASYTEANGIITINLKVDVYGFSYYSSEEEMFIQTWRFTGGCNGFYVHPEQREILGELGKRQALWEEPKGLDLVLTHEPEITREQLTSSTLWYPTRFQTNIAERKGRVVVEHVVGFDSLSYTTSRIFAEEDYQALQAAALKAVRDSGKFLTFRPEVKVMRIRTEVTTPR